MYSRGHVYFCSLVLAEYCQSAWVRDLAVVIFFTLLRYRFKKNTLIVICNISGEGLDQRSLRVVKDKISGHHLLRKDHHPHLIYMIIYSLCHSARKMPVTPK